MSVCDLRFMTSERLRRNTQHLSAEAAAAYRRGVMETLDLIDCDCHASLDGCAGHLGGSGPGTCPRPAIQDMRRRLREQAAAGEVL